MNKSQIHFNNMQRHAENKEAVITRYVISETEPRISSGRHGCHFIFTSSIPCSRPAVSLTQWPVHINIRCSVCIYSNAELCILAAPLLPAIKSLTHSTSPASSCIHIL